MTTANYSVQIGAPKKAVWEAMIDREKYSIWTKPFSENSSFIGEWREDAEIQFVDAGNGGTLALIETFRPHDLMVLKHIGLIIKEGKVEKSGHENWIGTLETYRFSESAGQTTLDIEMKAHSDYMPMFDKIWPQALQSLKDVSEAR